MKPKSLHQSSDTIETQEGRPEAFCIDGRPKVEIRHSELPELHCHKISLLDASLSAMSAISK